MQEFFAFGILLCAALLRAANASCQGESVGVLVPHQSDCGLFYSCDGFGNGAVTKCIDGYSFDAVRRHCRPSSLVFCGGVVVPPTPATAPTPAPGPTPTPTRTPAPTPAPRPASTPAPTLTTSPTPGPTTTVAPPSNGFTGNECKNVGVPDGALLPYPGDSARFIQCAHLKAVVKNCSHGLHFNKNLQVCDWPTAAGCTLK